jgi:hypothetical protein
MVSGRLTEAAFFVAPASMKERVSVAGDPHVAFLSRQRDPWYMAGRESEIAITNAFNHDRRETQAGNAKRVRGITRCGRTHLFEASRKDHART